MSKHKEKQHRTTLQVGLDISSSSKTDTNQKQSVINYL